MPAATTKDGLVKTTEKEWSKLAKLLLQFDQATATQCDDDGFSALRIVGHRAAWIDMYFKWCQDVAAGQPPVMPAPGYEWNQLEALNQSIFETQKEWSWAKACGVLEDAHRRLLQDISHATESALYGGPLAPGLKWTRGRYAEAAGPSHYRSAVKVLRKLLAAQRSNEAH